MVPSKILAKVGTVGYKLALLKGSNIHHVVHVSQLKRQVAPSVQVEDDIRLAPTYPEEEVHPIQFRGATTLSLGSLKFLDIVIDNFGRSE